MSHPKDFLGRTEISGSPADDCDILSIGAVTTTYPETGPWGCAGFVVLADAVVAFQTLGDPSGPKASTTIKAGTSVAVKLFSITLTSGVLLVHKYYRQANLVSG